MPGNSRRQGARRTSGSKKGRSVGSGGQRRKALRGKGPTPAAEQRAGHPAARRSSGKETRTTGRPAGSRSRGAGGGRDGAPELVVGRNSVVEALRFGVPATALYVAARIDSDDRVREALKRAADAGIPLLEAPRPELDRLTNGALHQGLAMQVPPYAYAHPDDLVARARDAAEAPLVVALDGVTDPRNLGAVLRSTGAFGGHGVVVPERRAAGMTAGAWKASAGAAVRVPVARATNLARTLSAFQDEGLVVAGLAADGEIDLADLEMATDPLCVVVGSEGRGVSRLVGETCDLRVRIPMSRATESLNAGVAAGIVLYEIAQRRATRSLA